MYRHFFPITISIEDKPGVNCLFPLGGGCVRSARECEPRGLLELVFTSLPREDGCRVGGRYPLIAYR